MVTNTCTQRYKRFVLKISIVFAIISACVLSSCDKMPDDKPLDGMWQLVSINDKDVKLSHAYWSFRKGLMQFSHEGFNAFYAHYTYVSTQMSIYDICHFTGSINATDNNEWVTMAEPDALKLWGINFKSDTSHSERVRVDYNVVCLDSKTMILSDENTRLVFRKF